MQEKKSLVRTNQATWVYDKSSHSGTSHQHHPTARVTMPISVLPPLSEDDEAEMGDSAVPVKCDPKTRYTPHLAWLNNFLIQLDGQGLAQTRASLLTELYAEFGPGSARVRDDVQDGLYRKFSKQFFGPGKDASRRLSTWLTRALEMMPFTVRRETIGQKVPTGWKQLAIDSTVEIREKAQEADVLIAVDEVAFNYHPQDATVIARRGARRVGGIVGADTKAGASVALAVEFGRDCILRPFIVMDGSMDARLFNQYKDHHLSGPGKAFVRFQKKHWVNAELWMMWCEHIKAENPGRPVLIICDHAYMLLLTHAVGSWITILQTHRG